MILILHIMAATSSVLLMSFLYFRPTSRNFMISYSLIGVTFISGTYLVLSTHTSLVHACVGGLVYLSLVSFGLALAQHRVSVRQRINEDETQLRQRSSR